MNNSLEKLQKKIKIQRFLIFILVLFLPATFLLTQKIEKDSQYESFKYSMLDPLRRFTPAEDYLINIQDLRKYLADIGNMYPDNVSIYYETINSGANISINKDVRLFPASLSKLVQAILITYKVEKGDMSWNQQVPVSVEDLSSGSGQLYKNGPKSYSVETLVEELLKNSDNTAQNVFKKYLSIDDYIKFQDKTGLQDLYNSKGYISAKEYTRILRLLYTSNFLTPENSQKILNYMSESSFKDFLSQGIPNGIKFAHKYGENKEENIFADSGIVYIPGRPYMITVIIKGKDSTDETRAWVVDLMRNISEKAYKASN
jgi:beta-lactamase class A